MTPPGGAEALAGLYRRLPGWTRDELSSLGEGLGAGGLDRTGPQGWARWSPRRQLSHMAYITTRWIMVLFGATALAWRPVDMSQFAAFINSPEDDRRFSARRYGEPGWLLARLEEACAAAAGRLEGWGERGGGREAGEAALLFAFSPGDRVGASEERAVDLWTRCMACHPDGFAPAPDRPGGFVLTPRAVLRHVLWDDLIHLRSIRMHAEAMGLAPAHPEAPVGGYAPAHPVR